ncbi:MAG: metallophosphoesterase family protein [Sumerlaeia bacterium]
MSYNIGLISDTHGSLHRDVFDLFEGVDCILHAGDIVDKSILLQLEAIAPTYAVVGNCDPPWHDVPEEHLLSLPCGKIVVLHSHLVADGARTPAGLYAQYKAQNPALIVYGHTHLQLLKQVENCWVVNPGPAGKPRLRDKPSLMLASWHETLNTWNFKSHLLVW